MNLWVLIGTVAMCVTSWIPQDVSQFWIEPDATSVFWFDAKTAADVDTDAVQECAKTIDYIVKTTDGAVYSEGKGQIVDGRLRVDVKLPQGYFELELPQTEQSFGVASQPAYCPFDATLASDAEKRSDLRERDDFFAIDSASTWLVSDDKAREDLIRNARRIGLATYRERLNWGRLEPKDGVLDYNGDIRSEFVRKTAKKYDMPVLELFHTSPNWMDKIGTFPRDLIKTADTWGRVGKQWEQYWNSIEVWNEPDISFSGDLPADQYVPVLKTVAQEFKRQNINTPIVGGIIASFRDDYMDSLAQNGGLDACDIFSFHTYCRAYEMEAVSLRYHNWLIKNKNEWKPIWITECGRPWRKGTSRPNGEADLESAIDIVQKGVVTKALGYDAYFPFVYVYYEENDNNFGMSDRNNAPLRSIAGYARSIYLLSGKTCFGSWELSDVERSYLFVDRKTDEKIAVLYSRDCKADRKVALPCKPSFVERVTGERLCVDENGMVDFSDGFLFVGLPKDFEPALKAENDVDKARNLRYAARVKHGADSRRNYSSVVRYDLNRDLVTVEVGGYSIIDSNAETFTGKLTVFNFESETKKMTICAKAIVEQNGELKDVSGLFKSIPNEIEVPGRGSAEFEFVLDSSKISPFNAPTLCFEVGDDGFLSFRLSRSITQENFEKVVSTIVPVDLSDLTRWRKNAPVFCDTTFNEKTSDYDWKLDAKYSGDGDKWAYPVYSLPIEVAEDGKAYLSIPDSDCSVKKYDLASFKGIAFYAEGDTDVHDGVLRLFTHSEKGEYYFTGSGFATADGKKRFIAIKYDALNAYGGTPQSFDPNRIRAIAIGGNVKSGENLTIKVSGFCFFK